MGRKVILVVEDQEDSILLLDMAFRKADLKQQVRFVRDGQQALDYLYGKADFRDRSGAPLPHLILLDLNLPKVTGLDVLAEIKRHDLYRKIPVVVYSSSSHPRDIDQAYCLGAAAYVVKPPSFAELLRLAEFLRDFWLEQVSLPDLGFMDEACSDVIKGSC